MTVSRSGFLKVCGLALVGAGVDVRTLEAFVSAPEIHAGAAAPFLLHDATAPLFRRHLGTAFDVNAASGERVRFLLAEVTERPLTKNVEQFSLIFHAPPGRAVPDGLHPINHQALGAFDLFIVPVGAPNDRRTVYQACFSRLRT